MFCSVSSGGVTLGHTVDAQEELNNAKMSHRADEIDDKIQMSALSAIQGC